MIQLNDIVLQRGEKQLFEGANLVIHPRQKIGLVGRNGAGKSTLFALLSGELSLDGGELLIPKNWTIARMAQEHPHSSKPCIEFVIDGDLELRKIEARLMDATEREDGEAMGHCHAQLETVDGYSARRRATQLMIGLGFNLSDLERPVTDFSGGWRMRLSLAQTLMCRSDLLLLDEPTNHLDLDTIIWLQQWLQQYEGTLIIISHDRDFLDSSVSHIASVEQLAIQLYKGDYSSYERQKAERIALQQAMAEKQQARKAEIESFVARFRYKASKAKQAQSRLKELQKMEDIAPAHADSPFHFRIPCHEKISTPLLNLSQVDAGYKDHNVLKNINFALVPGMRIGLLGANGQGKSTFIKTLVGDLPLQAGERVGGEHLRLGYFAQQQLEALNLQASAFDHIRKITPTASERDVRTFLGGFNFQGDRAFEVIKPFSGGEKTRLALALVVWQKPNVLVLDEPTNHLDLEMRHALTVAIQGFEGAVIIVSHDRHMLANTVDELYLVNEGRVEPYDGDLVSYSQWMLESRSVAESKSPAKNEAAVVDKKAQRQAAAARRAALAPLRKKVKKLEATMDQLQSKLTQIESEMADPSLYLERPEDAARLGKEQGVLAAQLEDLEVEWLNLSEQLEGEE